MTISKDAAAVTALRAMEFLAGSDDLLGVFLGATGLDRDALAQQLAEPEFQAAVLDFLLMDDAWVLDFAAFAELPPETVQQARAALPGGGVPHWT